MMRVAVIGGGVIGLAAAYILAKGGVKVVVYDKGNSFGGGAKTATFDGMTLDLGFMGTYPEVIELLESVEVEMEVTQESFSVSLEKGQGYEWGTRYGLSSLFLQKKNVLNPWFWKMIGEIASFKNDASSYLEELENNPERSRKETLGDFILSRGYSDLFQKAFLIPLCASIWSHSSSVTTFSAYLVLSFLCNSTALQVFGYPQRYAPSWSSQSFVNKIMKELEIRGCQVKANSEVHSVLTNEEGCRIKCCDGVEEAYDACVLTTHAPDALKILSGLATYDELRILGAFRYAHSDIFLHHDDNFMPQNRAAWSSTNVLGSTKDQIYETTYWLKKISDGGLPFFLTINPDKTPKDTLYKWSTSHPIPSVTASKASSELGLIQGKRRLWFCGAYQGCGLPEDGVKAGILGAKGLLRKSCTVQHIPKYLVPSWSESAARVLFIRFWGQFIATGCVILMEDGGTVFTFEGTERKNTLRVILRVHTPKFYWTVARDGEIGFAKAYISGDISFVDKNEGLLNFFQICIANIEMDTSTSKLNNKSNGWGKPLMYTSIIASAKYFLKYVFSKNTHFWARQNVFKHYDLSNEMFSLLLDETMTYSCPIFKAPGEDLKDAQLRKVHTLIEKARIKKEHHILEIGCGWGSLALEVVRNTGCKYTGVTLSQNQLSYVESKVKEAGLQDRVELLLCDYRQLPSNLKYDRIISCEMVEHVGHALLEEFFKCCESALAENGVLVLQFSSVSDENYDVWRVSPSFIKEYIFPGGCLLSLNRLTSAMAAASKLSVVHLQEIGVHYVDALKYWRQNLHHNQSKIVSLGFNEEFMRTWEYYFDYCAAGFKTCIIGNYQVVFARPGDVAALGNAPYNLI